MESFKTYVITQEHMRQMGGRSEDFKIEAKLGFGEAVYELSRRIESNNKVIELALDCIKAGYLDTIEKECVVLKPSPDGLRRGVRVSQMIIEQFESGNKPITIQRIRPRIIYAYGGRDLSQNIADIFITQGVIIQRDKGLGVFERPLLKSPQPVGV